MRPEAQVFIGAIVIDNTSNLLLGLSSQGHFAQGDADGIVMRPTGEFAPLTQQLVRLAGVDDSPSVILVPSSSVPGIGRVRGGLGGGSDHGVTDLIVLAFGEVGD